MTTTALAPRPEEPREVPAIPPPRNHRRHLASWTQKDWYVAAAVALAITVLGAATDAIFAADVLKLLVGVTFLAYLAAVGAVSVASACAFFAGHVIHHAPRKRWGWILAGVWALIGIGLALMRMVHSQIKIPEIPDGATPEEIDRIMRNATLSDLGLGAVMLVIFLATGILLIHKAKDLGDPDLRRMLKGLSERTRLLKLWSNAAAQSVLHGNLLARRVHHISNTLEQERKNAHEGTLAICDAAKEASIVAQAEIIGDPTATLMTLIPHEDTRYRPGAAHRDNNGAENSGTAGTEASAPASSEDKK
ncbi:hypothetical protein PV772_19180 [Pseudarthrobacter sp. CC12]|uniref:hypothetical protein n=1 Tax=Pseudarthrobacter sp. CC12 TaxID=3029193 RepID=UPI00326638F6